MHSHRKVILLCTQPGPHVPKTALRLEHGDIAEECVRKGAAKLQHTRGRKHQTLSSPSGIDTSKGRKFIVVSDPSMYGTWAAPLRLRSVLRVVGKRMVVLVVASLVHPRPMSTRTMIICGERHCDMGNGQRQNSIIGGQRRNIKIDIP